MCLRERSRTRVCVCGCVCVCVCGYVCAVVHSCSLSRYRLIVETQQYFNTFNAPYRQTHVTSIRSPVVVCFPYCITVVRILINKHVSTQAHLTQHRATHAFAMKQNMFLLKPCSLLRRFVNVCFVFGVFLLQPVLF